MDLPHFKILLFTLVFISQDDAANTNDNPFRDIVDSKYYVDKTSFIKYFHEQETPIVFSAPRQFGKTLTQTMLKAFYEITVDENGKPLQINSTQNYKAFSKLANKAKINDTIFEDKTFFNAQFGARPVIFLSFSSLKVGHLDEFLKSFKSMVQEMYQKHNYVLKSNKLKSNDEKVFRSFSGLNGTLDGNRLLTSGQALSGILIRHFSKQCVVLIDDVDAPALQLITNASADQDKMFNILKDFLEAFLKDNGAVKGAFITANTELARAYLNSVNKIAHHFFTRDEMARFFGLTEQEVKHLVMNSDFSLTDMSRFYCGYRLESNAERIYNPYSVTKCLEARKMGVYWFATEKKLCLNSLFEKGAVRKMMDDAFAGGGVIIERSEDMMEDLEISTLRDLLTSPAKINVLETYQRDFLSQFLWDLGYFTLLKDVEAGFVELTAPNLELRITMSEILAKSWMHHYGIGISEVRSYVKAFAALGHPSDANYKSFRDSVHSLFPKSILPASEFELASTLHSYLLYSPEQYATLDITTINKRANLLVLQKANGVQSGLIVGLRYKNCDGDIVLRELRGAGYEDVFEEEEYSNLTRYTLIGLCLNKVKQFQISFSSKSNQTNNETNA